MSSPSAFPTSPPIQTDPIEPEGEVEIDELDSTSDEERPLASRPPVASSSKGKGKGRNTLRIPNKPHDAAGSGGTFASDAEDDAEDAGEEGAGGKERLACEWEECQSEFEAQSELVKHLQADHILHVKEGFHCHWRTCKRRGEKQATRHSLITHCRAHTGERPYTCPNPQCLKTFTRSDAMNKHIRALHGVPPLNTTRRLNKDTGITSSLDADLLEAAEGIKGEDVDMDNASPSKSRVKREAEGDGNENEAASISGRGGRGAGGGGAKKRPGAGTVAGGRKSRSKAAVAAAAAAAAVTAAASAVIAYASETGNEDGSAEGAAIAEPTSTAIAKPPVAQSRKSRRKGPAPTDTPVASTSAGITAASGNEIDPPGIPSTSVGAVTAAPGIQTAVAPTAPVHSVQAPAIAVPAIPLYPSNQTYPTHLPLRSLQDRQASLDLHQSRASASVGAGALAAPADPINQMPTQGQDSRRPYRSYAYGSTADLLQDADIAGVIERILNRPAVPMLDFEARAVATIRKNHPRGVSSTVGRAGKLPTYLDPTSTKNGNGSGNGNGDIGRDRDDSRSASHDNDPHHRQRHSGSGSHDNDNDNDNDPESDDSFDEGISFLPDDGQAIVGRIGGGDVTSTAGEAVVYYRSKWANKYIVAKAKLMLVEEEMTMRRKEWESLMRAEKEVEARVEEERRVLRRRQERERERQRTRRRRREREEERERVKAEEEEKEKEKEKAGVEEGEKEGQGKGETKEAAPEISEMIKDKPEETNTSGKNAEMATVGADAGANVIAGAKIQSTSSEQTGGQEADKRQEAGEQIDVDMEKQEGDGVLVKDSTNAESVRDTGIVIEPGKTADDGREQGTSLGVGGNVPSDAAKKEENGDGDGNGNNAVSVIATANEASGTGHEREGGSGHGTGEGTSNGVGVGAGAGVGVGVGVGVGKDKDKDTNFGQTANDGESAVERLLDGNVEMLSRSEGVKPDEKGDGSAKGPEVELTGEASGMEVDL